MIASSNHVQVKYGICELAEKPSCRDITAVDGGFMYGYRKVRLVGDVGYVKAGAAKFGSKELASFVGKWVYVDASDYWATTARVGRG